MNQEDVDLEVSFVVSHRLINPSELGQILFKKPREAMLQFIK